MLFFSLRLAFSDSRGTACRRSRMGSRGRARTPHKRTRAIHAQRAFKMFACNFHDATHGTIAPRSSAGHGMSQIPHGFAGPCPY